MPKGVFVLLLVVVCAVAVCGYGQYNRQTSSSVTQFASRRYSYGFRIHHRRFSYKGHRYKLQCGKRRFLSVWRKYFKRYGSRRRCIQKLINLHLIGGRGGHKMNFYTYFKSHSGLSVKGNRFFFKGHAYTLRCRLNKFYSLWHQYYTQYRSVTKVFRVLYRNQVIGRTRTNYRTFYRSHRGFTLKDNRFMYNGNTYVLKCGSGKFYHLWYQYYQLYRSVTQIFRVLYRKHVFVRISYVTFYKTHRGLTLRGKMFVFHGKTYVIRCARSRFYRLWFKYYQQYQQSITKIFNLLYRKRMVMKVSYVNFYKTHHGFTLKGKTFIHNGHAYILRCGISRFYQLWQRYYTKYGSVTKIFRHMYHKRVFVRINYATYYRSHLGFKLKGKRFVYNGITYVLRCGLVRLYHLWYRYYEKYQSITKIFKVLYRKQLFVKINYINYYKTHSGFTLKGKLFIYDGRSYVLRCGRSKFYRLWYYYYERYQSISKIFRLMYLKRMFTKISYVSFYKSHRGFTLKGKTFVYRRHTYILRCGINKFYELWHRYYQRYESVTKIFSVMFRKRVFVKINYGLYYKKHGGFTVRGKTFVYNGRAYVLRCGKTRFYRLWYRYYEQYQSTTKIFRVLYRNGIFVKINYVSFYKSHRGFTLKGKLFVYEGRSFALRCARSKFYRLWYQYYGRYQSISKIFSVLYSKRIFVKISYANYYKSHRGFTLKGKSFVYKGHTYVLRCGIQSFYQLWHRYYVRYESVTKIFRVLHSKRVFARINYASFYKSHSGFSLEGKRFVYNGRAYVLRCRFNKFYRLWYRYYEQYQSTTKIFRVLYRNGIFVKLNYVSFYKTHRGFTLKGKIFVHDGKSYVIKCGRNKFYRLWYQYYQQHQSVTKIFRVLFQKRVFVKINYVTYYKTHRGVTLKGKTFVYKGHTYIIRCDLRRFYRFWHRYYIRYESVTKIFRVMYRKRVFVRINYVTYYRKHRGFILKGKSFVYSKRGYVLKCGLNRFYRLWYRYYEQYQSITKIFRVLYRNGIIAKINYVSYYKSHRGFPLKGKIFIYDGRSYVLKSGRNRFYRLWYRYYQRYQSVTKLFSVLYRKRVFVKINYVSYYKSHRGFTLKGKTFVYKGQTYILRCKISQFYILWQRYFHRYESVTKIFRVFLHRRVFVKINYVTYYRKHRGFILKGKRFVYNGRAYALRCGFNKFYRLWYRYYEQYHSITKIYRVLYRNRIFAKVNYVTYYKTHRGFSLKGKIFVYNRMSYVLRCRRNKFYRLWFIYYQQYQSITKVFRVLYRKRVFGKINYVTYYKAHHGFRLKGKTFVFKGHTYILRCGIRKFYQLWHGYYLQYQKVTKIFNVLYGKRIVVRINYLTYYRAHHGFILKGKRFIYNGRAYVLRSGFKKFYRLWYRYYEQYQSVTKIFKVLYRNGIFVKISYVSFYKTHRGFTLKGKLFVYKGKSYVIRCGRNKFYRLWYQYYQQYKTVTNIFSVLYRKRVFATINYADFYKTHRGFTLKGKTFVYAGHTYYLRCGITKFYRLWLRYYHRYESVTKIFRVLYRKRVVVKINYITYYKKHRGFILRGKRFVYSGRAYILRCTFTRFYRLWYRYYEQYHSITKIFRVLYRNKIFAKINYVTFYRTHLGFTLKGKIFDYDGRSYALKCGRNKFYRLWYQYYVRYQSVTKIFKALYHKRVIVRVNYVSYYKTHRGFTLKGKSFVYKGHTYFLRCEFRKFYQLWYRYFVQYKSITRIFRVLYKKRVFVKINYLTYFRKHRGFILNGNKFVYNGRAHVLKCGLKRFYRLWYRYYEQYQSITKIYRVLYRNGIFSKVNYVSFYKTHRGLPLKGKVFVYSGRSFVLRCGRNKFYRLWYRYFQKYRSVTKIFSVLYRKKIFVRISYANFYKTNRGFTLKGKSFVYNGHTYFLRCGVKKFFLLWHRYYLQYESVAKIFRVLYRKRVFVKINYVIYYRKHRGFILKNKRFVYNGRAYVLRCGMTKFYRLWYRFYERYQSITKIFKILYRKQIFSKINYVTYFNTHHGFKLRGKIFFYDGRIYVLRCARSRLYRLWYRYFQQYHSVTKIFSVLYSKKVFVRINFVTYYKTHLGLSLKGKTFVYNGHAYILKCGVKRFYRLWHKYYLRYDSVTKIFKVLFRKRVFVRINYVTYYRKHRGFILKGKSFVYNGKSFVLRCGLTRFYRLWYRYYERYQSITKIFKKMYIKRLFVAINYLTFYKTHRGFKLRGKIFVYNGRKYVLRCSSSRFYSLWYRYYEKYQSITKIFKVLYSKKVFVRRTSVKVNYSTFYKTHHGFTLKGKRFIYNGNEYVLRCGRSRFYDLWYKYYKKYHSVAKIFRVLIGKHIVNRFNYVFYYQRHHGFVLKGRRFLFNGKTYVLSLRRSKFYRLWYRYYTRYRSISKVFRVLYKRHFVVQHGGSSRISYLNYYKNHRGFRLKGKRFVFNGNAYLLNMPRRKFYRLWYRYFRKYRSIEKIFTSLHDKRCFSIYRGGAREDRDESNDDEEKRERVTTQSFHSHVSGQRVVKKEGRFVRYIKRYHGFTIRNNRFNYRGKAFKLRCSAKMWFTKWISCYKRLDSVGGCLDKLQGRGLIVPFKTSAPERDDIEVREKVSDGDKDEEKE